MLLKPTIEETAGTNHRNVQVALDERYAAVKIPCSPRALAPSVRIEQFDGQPRSVRSIIWRTSGYHRYAGYDDKASAWLSKVPSSSTPGSQFSIKCAKFERNSSFQTFYGRPIIHAGEFDRRGFTDHRVGHTRDTCKDNISILGGHTSAPAP